MPVQISSHARVVVDRVLAAYGGLRSLEATGEQTDESQFFTGERLCRSTPFILRYAAPSKFRYESGDIRDLRVRDGRADERVVPYQMTRVSDGHRAILHHWNTTTKTSDRCCWEGIAPTEHFEKRELWASVPPTLNLIADPALTFAVFHGSASWIGQEYLTSVERVDDARVDGQAHAVLEFGIRGIPKGDRITIYVNPVTDLLRRAVSEGAVRRGALSRGIFTWNYRQTVIDPTFDPTLFDPTPPEGVQRIPHPRYPRYV